MDKSTNGVKSQSVSKSQNNISRLGQPWDNGGTNLLFTGMNDDSKQKAQVLDSLGLFLWCLGRGERIRTSGLYVRTVEVGQFCRGQFETIRFFDNAHAVYCHWMAQRY